jgi:ferritin-like metal-binding protein YciE
MELNTLAEGLYAELADLYDAEQQLVQKLPSIAQSIVTPNFRAAIEKHVEETRQQVSRLETIFNLLRRNSGPETCESMRGLLQEVDDILAAPGEAPVKDAILLGALQRVEHYEIAAYGTARAFAEQLDLDEIADLLQQSLEEEAHADRELTQFAEGGLFSEGINIEAGHVGRPRP